MIWRSLCLTATVLIICLQASSAIRDLRSAHAVTSTDSTASSDDLILLMPDLSQYYDDAEPTSDDDYPSLEGLQESTDYPSADDSDLHNLLDPSLDSNEDGNIGSLYEYASSDYAPDGTDSGGIIIASSSPLGSEGTGVLLSSQSGLGTPAVPCDTQEATYPGGYTSEYSVDQSDPDSDDSDESASELVASDTEDPASDDGDAMLTQTAEAATDDTTASGDTDGDVSAAAAGTDTAGGATDTEGAATEDATTAAAADITDEDVAAAAADDGTADDDTADGATDAAVSATEDATAASTTDEGAAAAEAAADDATYDSSDLSDGPLVGVTSYGGLVMVPAADNAAAQNPYGGISGLTHGTYDEAEYQDGDSSQGGGYPDDDTYSGITEYSSDGESSEYADEPGW